MGAQADVTKLTVKVVPGASRSEIAGWLGQSLKIRVAAPPEDGKANRAVIKLLASALGIPNHQIRLKAGGASPRKTLEINGLSHAEITERLGTADTP